MKAAFPAGVSDGPDLVSEVPAAKEADVNSPNITNPATANRTLFVESFMGSRSGLDDDEFFVLEFVRIPIRRQV
jgi:hypothetical protein